MVKPSLPVHSVADLIKLAKAKPGVLNYASSGPGTPYHMAGELFKAMAGVDIQHIPYKGSSGARNDLLGGQVALATTGSKRSNVLPDLPTVSEAGVPGYNAVIWLGLMAPKGTPAAITGKLNAEITKIVSEPAVQQAWAKQGAVPMTMTLAEFTQYLNDDIAKWAKVVKISGGKVDD